MKLKTLVLKEVEAKILKLHVKVRDEGNYKLLSSDGETIVDDSENYVPSFFPGNHYGDYLIFDIDIDTGTIVNWKKDPDAIRQWVDTFKETG